jgi:membrane-associated protease RseP (regulator of RpoE activity)
MKDQPSNFKATLMVLLTISINGCAVQATLEATGGSKADGVVALSYEYSKFEVPTLNPRQGEEVAKQRCASWGYAGAEPFGGSTRQCTERSPFTGCGAWLVTFKYQCVDSQKSEVPQPVVLATQPQPVPTFAPSVSHGKRQAVGVTFGSDLGGLRVMTVEKYGPAARAGLSPGDLITKIDGKPCAAIYWEYAAQSIINAPNDVTLTIQGKGDRVLSLRD